VVRLRPDQLLAAIRSARRALCRLGIISVILSPILTFGIAAAEAVFDAAPEAVQA